MVRGRSWIKAEPFALCIQIWLNVIIPMGCTPHDGCIHDGNITSDSVLFTASPATPPDFNVLAASPHQCRRISLCLQHRPKMQFYFDAKKTSRRIEYSRAQHTLAENMFPAKLCNVFPESLDSPNLSCSSPESPWADISSDGSMSRIWFVTM